MSVYRYDFDLFDAIQRQQSTEAIWPTHDFYKPQLDSEYPQVDGPLSIATAYLGALDASYARYREKWARSRDSFVTSDRKDPKSATSMADFDYPVFHSPYGKLVQKGHARLVDNTSSHFPTLLAMPNSPAHSLS